DRARLEAAALRPPRELSLAGPPAPDSLSTPAPGPVERDAGEPALPLAPTPLVGREREEAAVVHLLRHRHARLVTLLGPPGVGKTGLAIQVAASCAADFADGVAFVPLAPVTDPALIAPSVARALGLAEVGGAPPGRVAEALAERLRDQRLLLVLDNFEQLTDG